MFPVLALDFGRKHIGLSISDSKGLIASPLPTLSITKNRDLSVLLSEIKSICEEYKVASILIGQPQSFNEGQNVNNRRIEEFSNAVKKRISLPVTFGDESFSTSTAKDMLISQGQHFKANKSKIDSLAASVFLQEYLNSKNSLRD